MHAGRPSTSALRSISVPTIADGVRVSDQHSTTYRLSASDPVKSCRGQGAKRPSQSMRPARLVPGGARREDYANKRLVSALHADPANAPLLWALGSALAYSSRHTRGTVYLQGFILSRIELTYVHSEWASIASGPHQNAIQMALFDPHANAANY